LGCTVLNRARKALASGNMNFFALVVGVKALVVAALLAIMASIMIAPASASCGRDGVVVFAAYWCPYCRRAEAFLKTWGIPYRRIETANNRRVQRFMIEKFGSVGVPVVLIDDSFRVGFDEVWMKKALCLR
jgi:glutaredoxin